MPEILTISIREQPIVSLVDNACRAAERLRGSGSEETPSIKLNNRRYLDGVQPDILLAWSLLMFRSLPSDRLTSINFHPDSLGVVGAAQRIIASAGPCPVAIEVTEDKFVTSVPGADQALVDVAERYPIWFDDVMSPGGKNTWKNVRKIRRRVPISVIKIEMCTAPGPWLEMVGWAITSGIRVVIERIETQASLDSVREMLQHNGVDLGEIWGQGWLWGKPQEVLLAQTLRRDVLRSVEPERRR